MASDPPPGAGFPDGVLLVSGFGDDDRGGVFAVGPDGVEILDSVPTVGMACTDDRLVRLLRAPGERTSVAELVVSDAIGVASYHRLDGVVDPHDVVLTDDGYLVTSTGTNEVIAVGADGSTRTIWRGDGEPDSWHVNCLVRRDGRTWATAFGEFTTFRAWSGSASDGRGICFALDGADRFGGLSHPHSPRPDGAGWLVCESAPGTVTRLDPAGRPVARIALGGYTRGLAVTADAVFVGVSAPRDDPTATAAVVRLARTTLTEIDRTPVPAREIYEVLVAPTVLADGLRRGFSANASRLAACPPGALPAARFADPADREAFACRIAADPPARLGTGERVLLPVEVANTGRGWLVGTGTEPILLASRWQDDGGQIDGPRAPLPVVLAPGQRTTVTLPVVAPEPGPRTLRISLVREGAYWFDDRDPAHGLVAEVTVAPTSA